ncbi:MAG: hypothetical protein KJ601_00080 [Nanoarchaeota archaeon]|nr:hypothetical protein [Nanoarchaeota archaeon]MBU1703856.1 hypothetical protein [Nanoarchaeota archaeon]
MIQKIKDLIAVKEHIDQITTQVKEHSSSVEDLNKKVVAMHATIEEIRSNNQQYIKDFKENLASMSESKEELKKEVYDFKLLKTQMQKKLLEKFETELGNHLCLSSEKLQNDLNEYNKLKDKLSSAISTVNTLSSEITKFTDISKNIKKEDFELKNFAQQLAQGDKEKLELMRKIDSLERLVSKIRRSQ